METMFEELKRYTKFGEAEELALKSGAPLVTEHAEAIAASFYARLDNHPRALRTITDQAQRERLHCTLVQWIRDCFAGPWDEAYFARRLAIGRTHVRIGLEQHYMFAAMNVVRLAMLRCCRESDEYNAIAEAINKLIDLELAIMLHSYADAYVARLQHDERNEKAQLQKGLEVAHARYDQVVENVDMLVTTVDSAGNILLFNRRCEALTGLSRDDARGRDWRQLFARANEYDFVTRLWRTSPARATFFESSVELGGRLRTLRWQFSALATDDGPIIGALGIDITEARELAERTRRAERLAGLGTMAAGLAHEIRNPLNAAQLQCHVLKRRLERANATSIVEARETSELIFNELKRVEGLVSEFLQFARPRPIVRRTTRLADTIEAVIALLSAEADERGIELVARVSEPVIACIDEESIKQVLHNLIRNALDASDRGAQVSVELGVEGDDAVIRVLDHGKGLPSDVERLFEPFFTTKEHGTGLGLAIVHRIVTEHHGRVDAERVRDTTIFTVRLPFDFS